jgi:hypothetical protein
MLDTVERSVIFALLDTIRIQHFVNLALYLALNVSPALLPTALYARLDIQVRLVIYAP